MNQPQIRAITDAGVAGLAISEGRAELLEEIMATTPLEATAPQGPQQYDDRPPRHRRWIAAVGAAAAVAAIAGAVALPQLVEDEPSAVDAPLAAVAPAEMAVLDAEGWPLKHAFIDGERNGALTYEPTDHVAYAPESRGVTLDIQWLPAEQYDSYLRARRQSYDADLRAGRPVGTTRTELLGAEAVVWAEPEIRVYAAARPVVGDRFLVVMGSGMAEAVYRDLLTHLRAIEPADLQAHLPDEMVTDAERADVIAQLLEGAPLPEGWEPFTGTETNHGVLAVDLASSVLCAWHAQYRKAEVSGDESARQQAADAMASTREWPIMDVVAEHDRDWAEKFWEYADALAEGRAAGSGLGDRSCRS